MVPGSIPGGVTYFFALGSTQPLAKMSTRNIPGGKGGRCAGVTISPPLSAECHKNLGHTGPVTGLFYLYCYHLKNDSDAVNQFVSLFNDIVTNCSYLASNGTVIN